MENASKALLMAGGMLLVMLVVALVLFAWNTFSNYFSSTQDLSEITDLTEFNLQFTNYDRDNVYGYELLSLINQVADYNMRFSNLDNSKNDQGYKPVTLIINFNGQVNKLAYEDTNKLFTQNMYIQNGINNVLKNIFNQLSGLENSYGKENMQNLSKSINSIFLSKEDFEYETEIEQKQLKKNAIIKFNSITKGNIADLSIEDVDIESNYNHIQSKYKEDVYKYNEFTTFKKAIFKSDSSKILYDDSTGRIIQMQFDFTGEIK